MHFGSDGFQDFAGYFPSCRLGPYPVLLPLLPLLLCASALLLSCSVCGPLSPTHSIRHSTPCHFLLPSLLLADVGDNDNARALFARVLDEPSIVRSPLLWEHLIVWECGCGQLSQVTELEQQAEKALSRDEWVKLKDKLAAARCG